MSALADVCFSKYLGVAGACATFISSFGLGWEKIGSKRPDKIDQTTEEPVTSIDTAN